MISQAAVEHLFDHTARKSRRYNSEKQVHAAADAARVASVRACLAQHTLHDKPTKRASCACRSNVAHTGVATAQGGSLTPVRLGLPAWELSPSTGALDRGVVSMLIIPEGRASSQRLNDSGTHHHCAFRSRNTYIEGASRCRCSCCFARRASSLTCLQLAAQFRAPYRTRELVSTSPPHTIHHN